MEQVRVAVAKQPLRYSWTYFHKIYEAEERTNALTQLQATLFFRK
jgi:hypothetical protein